MTNNLEELPEFEEGVHSTLEPHYFIKGYFPCSQCDIPYLIAIFENQTDYCKRASISIAKRNGTFNPDYKDDPWGDNVKVLKKIKFYEKISKRAKKK